MNKIQAIIFDMDGVISNTQYFHSDTESELLKDIGINISPQEIINQYAGTPDRLTFKYILERNHKKGNVEELLKKKWEIMDKKIKNNIKPIDGVKDLLELLTKQKFILAVASSSKAKFINRILYSLKIKKYFKVIASGDEVKKGKPDPELFLLAAKKLNINPSCCIVIEDARNGILAAKAAGMKCIAITTTHKREDLQQADKIIDSFSELSVDDIIRM